jgi:hypothetical protein
MNPTRYAFRGALIAADELIPVLIESGLAAPAAQRMQVPDVLDVFPVAVAWNL